MPGGGNPCPEKRSCLDVDLVLMKIRQEYNERCPCKKNFKLCTVSRRQAWLGMRRGHSLHFAVDGIVEREPGLGDTMKESLETEPE